MGFRVLVHSRLHSAESFKILACYALPMITPCLRVFKSPTHDPIILIPMGKIIRVFNVSELSHREPPPFPSDDEDIIPQTKKLRLDTDTEDDTHTEKSFTPGLPRMLPPYALFQTVEGWDVSAAKAKSVIPNLVDINDCEVCCEGSVIIGVGARGTLFVWKRLPPA